MFSKELALAVLDYPNGIVSCETHGNEVMILSTTALHDDVYNVYELANKCKEWALNVGNKNYYIWTGINHNSKWDVFVTEFKSLDTFEPVRDQAVFEPLGSKDTEPEAVFRACKWILKEKNDS